MASPAFAESLCPLSIQVEQSLKTTPEGWDAGQNGYVADLSCVTVFSGPPAEQAYLVPSGKDEKDLQDNEIWPLTPDEHGYWIPCNYAHTTVVISKKLPTTFKECEVKYQSNVYIAGSRVPESVQCE